MYDPHTRDSRGFGFVTMETLEEAEAAKEGINGSEINGRILTVEKVGYIFQMDNFISIVLKKLNIYNL